MKLLCLHLVALLLQLQLPSLSHHRTCDGCSRPNDHCGTEMAWLVAQFHGNLAVSGLTTQRGMRNGPLYL